MTERQWRVQKCERAPGDIEVVIADGFKIYIPLTATNWDDAKRARMIKAAHKVAAAPDLLDAATFVVSQFDAQTGGKFQDPDAIAMARAAIAKATGKVAP